MKLEEFCIRLNRLDLSNARRALAILWFYDCEVPGACVKASTLASDIYNSGLGNPNPTQLSSAISRTGLAIKDKSGFKLKPTKRDTIKDWINSILEKDSVEVDLEDGYIPEAIWKSTRGYIEKIAFQMNGCYQYGFYDGASVLLRRLAETLLIECYEQKGNRSRIIDSDGNYFMLSGIIGDAIDNQGLSLGCETKKALREIKIIGDRSAHNRRYNAVQADLNRLQLGSRLVVDELIQLARLKK